MKKDLEPYVCLFENCDLAFDIFPSSKEWIDHIRTQHRMKWHCVAKNHEPKAFDSQASFEGHMREEHRGRFREEQLPFLAENSGRPVGPTFEQCPFCGQNSGNLEVHVAHHLQYLALLSLPMFDEGCNEMSGRTSTSSRRYPHSQSRDSMKDYQRHLPIAEFKDLRETDETRPKDASIPNTDFESAHSVSVRLLTWQSLLLIKEQHLPVTETEQRWDPILQSIFIGGWPDLQDGT